IMAMLRSLLLLFIVFSMVNAEVDIVEKCPFGWTHFGGRCYKFFSQSANWITAERNCQTENDFLLSLLPTSTTRCWVGTHDGEQEGQWVWSDGSTYDYTNWCSAEPNNDGVENCGEININQMSNRCWNDQPCSSQTGFVCAKSL
uniref:C-type lectin domain-containing protein n=1 Tax=Sinocyclocheilus anshuiensis TaxID=1608454 RepID=A0A671KG66_9TELE